MLNFMPTVYKVHAFLVTNRNVVIKNQRDDSFITRWVPVTFSSDVQNFLRIRCWIIYLIYIAQLLTKNLWCTVSDVSKARLSDWSKRLYGSQALAKRLKI